MIDPSSLPSFDTLHGHVSAAHEMRAQGDVEDIISLVLSRYPHATVDQEAARMDARIDLLPDTFLLVYQDGDNVRVRLNAQPQREDPPWPGTQDRDGLTTAFPTGMPWGKEREAIYLLVAMARRLGGTVHCAGKDVELTPTPESMPNLTVATRYWLQPEHTLAVVRKVAPDAVDLAEQAALANPLDEPQEHSMYGIGVDCGVDGLVEVRVLESEVPPALLGVDWARGGVTLYQVVYVPADPAEAEVFAPDPELQARRERMFVLVERLAAALHAEVSGDIIDGDGFLVDPAHL